MDQWFIALDKKGDRTRALKSLNCVNFIPNWGENRIRAAVENRPDWCISRQRTWGSLFQHSTTKKVTPI